MPKCGSSALQSYFCTSEFYNAAEPLRIGYVALLEDGRLLEGQKLIEQAAATNYGYITSCSAKTFANFNPKISSDIKSQILLLRDKYETLIFSNEGWGSNLDHFPANFLFDDPQFEVSVLAYVRPQIEWMNSAWWQWGAWTTATLARWINTNREKAKWSEISNQWEDKPWVKKIILRLLPENVIKDFNAQMKIPALPLLSEATINKGLSEPILRLFQHYRHLRPGPHDSEIEFILAKHLPNMTGNSPWVIPGPILEGLIKYYLEDNQNLIKKLAPDQKNLMLNNARWWNSDAYNLLPVKPVNIGDLKRIELHALAASAIEVIVNLNKKVQALEK